MRNEGKGDTCVLNVLKCLVGELGPWNDNSGAP